MNPLEFLELATGGRPAANDDFRVLQALPLAVGLPALLAGVGPCLVSGCRVFQTGSVWNVAPGLVWDGVNLLPFPGQSNVTLPLMFAPGAPVVVDERAYQDGTTRPTIKSRQMELVAVVAGAPNLVVDAAGAITFWQRVTEHTREVGVVEYVTDTTGYDATGLGLGTKCGWALANGQNGTRDLRGQFVVGQHPDRADYDTVGKTGGEETHTLSLAEMPRHDHTGNVSQARFAYQDGHVTLNSNTDDSSNEPNLGRVAAVQPQGGGQAHENRPPFYVLAARQWVGF